MAAFRAFSAVLAGFLLAFVLGAIYDYLPEGSLPDPSKMTYMYPWLFGGVGFISSLVAVLVFYPAVSQAAVRAALKAGGSTAKAPVRQPAAPVKAATKSEVPGMPSFDFDAAKAKIDELKQGDPAKAVPGPSAGSPDASGGSRPAAPAPEPPKAAQ